MRNPLPALEAFSRDARAVTAADCDGDASLGGWLAVTKAAERVSALPAPEREAYLESLPSSVLPPVACRPTLVHDGMAPPRDAVTRWAERLRLEAESMERAGCLEMAFATVAAVCRLTVNESLASRMLATAHLGRIARQLGDLRTAQECYTSVVSEAARGHDGPLEAMGLLGLGALARMRGNRPDERRWYGQALARAYPGGATERSAHQGLMNAAISEHRLADALLHGWRVYDLAPEGSDVRAMVLSNLALTAMEAEFTEAALQGFRHVLTLTDVLRIRMPVFGGAVRAAAKLGNRPLLSELDTQGQIESERAIAPFEVASFFVSAAEAWATIPDVGIATARLSRARTLMEANQFHELANRAEQIETQLHAAVAPTRATTPWRPAVTPDSAWNERVATGIHRLAGLSV
jgi:hypothetical protein